MKKSKSNWRLARFDGLLYLANHVVARVPSHRFRLWFYRQFLRCTIGPGSLIYMDVRFDTLSGLRVGRNSTINYGCRLDSRGLLTIGDNVSISAEVCILTADHDPQSVVFAGREKPVVIGDYVFVGTRALILPGVTLGRGAIVAAGAVVTKDVAPYAIVGGVPARVIGQRPQDLNYSGHYYRMFS